MRSTRSLPALALASTLAACGTPWWGDGEPEEDLPLGEVLLPKGDGDWGYATQCKPIPQRTPLADPRITISIDGLTLRLEDLGSDFVRVYPIGAGTINHNAGETTYGTSRSMFPVLRYKRNDFEIEPPKVEPCTIWWWDKDAQRSVPVFAGMPFMSWHGPYGIHGPIDEYTAPNGGRLRRGYVSHGCIRMESADVLEVWAHIRHRPRVPVRVQQEIDRDAGGAAFDVPERWLLSECDPARDDQCNFAGGYCRPLPSTGRGFCTMKCSKLCPDRHGQPVSYCVPDEHDASTGYCTLRSSDFNHSCKRYAGFARVADQQRFSDPDTQLPSCMPN